MHLHLPCAEALHPPLRLNLAYDKQAHSYQCAGQVAESGEGYTLSGKPLDPTSSAARAYGLKPELLASAPTAMTD